MNTISVLLSSWVSYWLKMCLVSFTLFNNIQNSLNILKVAFDFFKGGRLRTKQKERRIRPLLEKKKKSIKERLNSPRIEFFVYFHFENFQVLAGRKEWQRKTIPELNSERMKILLNYCIEKFGHYRNEHDLEYFVHRQSEISHSHKMFYVLYFTVFV